MLPHKTNATFLLLSLIHISACGVEGWDYGPGPYDWETQMNAVSAILRVYKTYLGEEPIEKLRDKHVTLRWEDGPPQCWKGVECHGLFNPNSFTLTMQVLECIADTSLAHELYHAIAAASGHIDDSIDYPTDNGLHQRFLAYLASDAAREVACKTDNGSTEPDQEPTPSR